MTPSRAVPGSAPPLSAGVSLSSWAASAWIAGSRQVRRLSGAGGSGNGVPAVRQFRFPRPGWLGLRYEKCLRSEYRVSVLGLDGEGKLSGPGAQSRGGRFSQVLVGGVLLNGALAVRGGELPVELEVLEAVGGD